MAGLGLLLRFLVTFLVTPELSVTVFPFAPLPCCHSTLVHTPLINNTFTEHYARYYSGPVRDGHATTIMTVRGEGEGGGKRTHRTTAAVLTLASLSLMLAQLSQETRGSCQGGVSLAAKQTPNRVQYPCVQIQEYTSRRLHKRIRVISVTLLLLRVYTGLTRNHRHDSARRGGRGREEDSPNYRRSPHTCFSVADRTTVTRNTGIMSRRGFAHGQTDTK